VPTLAVPSTSLPACAEAPPKLRSLEMACFRAR
jgi:hypothetical protein